MVPQSTKEAEVVKEEAVAAEGVRAEVMDREFKDDLNVRLTTCTGMVKHYLNSGCEEISISIEVRVKTMNE